MTQLTIPEIQATEAYSKVAKSHIKALSKFLNGLNRDMTVGELLRAVGA